MHDDLLCMYVTKSVQTGGVFDAVVLINSLLNFQAAENHHRAVDTSDMPALTRRGLPIINHM